MSDRDGDLRILGARDGMVTALLRVRAQIAQYEGPYIRINPRHVRKLAERDRIVAPLRRLEKQLLEQVEITKAAYERSRQP